MGLKRPDPATLPPWVVALDPAKRRCGVAVFHKGKLFAASTLRERNPRHLPRTVIDQVGLWTGSPAYTVRWVAEYPVVYQHARAREKNLVGLVELVERVESVVGDVAHITPPAIWKGQISKSATKHRLMKRLERSELDAMFDDSGDTYDAIGIGLWYLCRVNRGLVPFVRSR